MADFMITVGADFSGVISQLNTLNSAIDRTQAKANSSTRVARLPAGVAQIASGGGVQGQLDPKQTATFIQQQATAAALMRQTAEVNARRQGSSVSSIAADRTGKGSELDNARRNVATQLGLVGEDLRKFNTLWNAQVGRMFSAAGGFQNVLAQEPKQVLGAFSRYANADAGPLRALGVEGNVQATRMTAAEREAILASEKIEATASAANAKAEQQMVGLQRRMLAALRRRTITLEEANNTLMGHGATPKQLIRQSPTGTAYIPRDLSRNVDAETGRFVGTPGEKRVYSKQGSEATAKEVAEQSTLLQMETEAMRGRLAAESIIKRELDLQVAASKRLTELMVRGNLAQAQRTTAMLQAQQQNPDFIAAKTAERAERARLNLLTDPQGENKARAQREREVARESRERESSSAKRRRDEEKMWDTRSRNLQASVDEEVKGYRQAVRQDNRVGATGDVTDAAARKQQERSRTVQAREARQREQEANEAVRRNRYSVPAGPAIPSAIIDERADEKARRTAAARERAAQQRAALAAQRAAEQRATLAATDPSYRTGGIAEARLRSEAFRRTQQPITPVAYDASTNFAMERRVLGIKMQMLLAEERKLAAANKSGVLNAEQNAIDAQITALKAQQRQLQTAETAAGRAMMGGNVPPGGRPPRGPGAGQGGGGSFYDRMRHSGGAGGFFAGGAMSTIRYGVPSMLMYGAATGIADTIREAEELQYNLARLEGQFESTFRGQDFGPIRGDILDLAKNTGLAADSVAELQIQMTGAFASESIGGLSGQDLVKSQVSDAAKLAQTIRIPIAELTDGATAASLNFNRTVGDIGDVALALEEASGVLAQETVSFIGDIAPVAKEAGYTLEEFSAIAAVAQQRSGRSGTALAESFGRVIPALTENKSKLMELAAAEASLGTPEFIDSIRQSDVKGIFDGIGRSYANMSKESQQLVVQLLGGRREAQAIIPAIANRDLVDRYTNVAEGAEGTLEERFAKIQTTLTNEAQRLGETLRQFGVEILEAGIADGFSTAIQLAKTLLQILGPIADAFGTVNDLLGGWPSKILLAVGALKAARALMTFTGPNGSKTMFGANLLAYGQGVPMGGRVAAAKGAYNRAVTGYTPPVAPFVPPNAMQQYGGPSPQLVTQATKPRAALLGATAGLKGLGPYAAIIALGTLYESVNTQLNQEKEALKELDEKYKEENSNLDLTDESVRSRRSRDLERQSARAAASVEWTTSFWRTIANVQSDAERLASQAQAVKFDSATSDFYGDLDTGLENRLQDMTLPKFGAPTSQLRKDLQKQIDDGKNSFFDDAWEFISLEDAADEIINTVGAGGPMAGKRFDRFVDKVKELGDIRGKVENEVLAAILDPDDPLGGLTDIAEGRTGASDTVIEQAQGVLDNAKSKGMSNKTFARDVAALQDDVITELDENALDLEQLAAAHQAGVISMEQYAKKSRERLESRRALLSVGDDTKANEIQILETYQQERETWKGLADAITGQQEIDNRIAEALGTSGADMNNRKYMQNVANLRDPNFQDREARLDAAINIIEQKKNFDLQLAMDSGNMEEVMRLYAEGSEVPVEAQTVIYTSRVFKSQEWLDLAEDMRTAIAATARNVRNPMTGEVTPVGVNLLGEDPESIANNLIGEIIQTGKLSEETMKSVGSQISQLLTAGSASGLTSEQKGEITGSIDGFIDLLIFAGTAKDKILDFLSGGSFAALGNDPMEDRSFGGLLPGIGMKRTPEQQAVLDQYDEFEADSPFPKIDPEEQRAKLDASNFNNAIQAEFSRRKAAANRNAVAVAEISKQAAQAEKDAAQGIEDPAERVAAIKSAEEAMIKADQELISAIKSIGDAKRSYSRTMAELAGNFVGAAQFDVAQARADYRDAVAAGDEAGMWAAMEAEQVGLDRIREERLADNRSGLSLTQARQTISGDTVGAAETGVAIAQAARNAAQGTREINETQQALEEARNDLRQANLDQRQAMYGLIQASLEFHGDFIGAARIQLVAAQEMVRNARGAAETIAAQQAMIAASKAMDQAAAQHRAAAYGLLQSMVADDPLASIKLEIKLAQLDLLAARGAVAKAEAQTRLNELTRERTAVMSEIRQSQFSLRQAELEAMEDDVGAANVAAQAMRQQLADAQKRGAGDAELNGLRAEVIGRDKAARDALYNERMDDAKWLFDMGKTSKSAYIQALEGIKSTLIPGTKSFKDLELTIKQLKDDISGDFQANLPSDLSLPTLYEARRLGQTNGPNSGNGPSIGYQDQRVQNITIVAPPGTTEAQLVDIVVQATSTDRSGSHPPKW